MGGEEGGGGGGFEAFSVLIMLRRSMVEQRGRWWKGHARRRKSDYIQTEKMKLSQSRDPRPHSGLQRHFFNLTSSSRQLRFCTLASCALCSALLNLYLLSISASMAGKQATFLSSLPALPAPVWRHTANLCESNRMSLCSPRLSL